MTRETFTLHLTESELLSVRNALDLADVYGTAHGQPHTAAACAALADYADDTLKGPRTYLSRAEFRARRPDLVR